MSDRAETVLADRLPPHSVESEMSLIGAMMLAGGNPTVFAQMRGAVGADDFFQADHRILYEVMREMERRGKPIDGMTVRDELERRKLTNEVGGIAYLAEIISSVPNFINGEQYAARVRETAVLRRIITVAGDAMRAAYGRTDERTPADIARRAADAMASLAVSGSTDAVVTLGESAIKILERRDNPEVRRIPTGILGLDNVIGGLAKSKFTMVGSPPRVGKSQLIKQMGRNISGRGVAFGIVTVEEDKEKIAENMLSNQSKVPNHRIAYGQLNAGEWQKLEDGAVRLAGLPYYIDDAQHELDDIVSAVERLATKYKCEVIAVDHLHLISCDAQTREREVSKISKALKAAFKRCNVAGIAAAQLNRGQDGVKPTLRSLRDSGSLEADGDCIMLLHREDAVRYQEDGYTPTRVLEVDVAKNKDGRVGEVPLHFDGETQTITDMVCGIEDPF